MMETEGAKNKIVEGLKERHYNVLSVHDTSDGDDLVRLLVGVQRKDYRSINDRLDWEAFREVAKSINCYVHPHSGGDSSLTVFLSIDHFEKVKHGVKNLGERMSESYWIIQGEYNALSMYRSVVKIADAYMDIEGYFRELIHPNYWPDRYNLKCLIEFGEMQDELKLLSKFGSYFYSFTSDLSIPECWVL